MHAHGQQIMQAKIAKMNANVGPITLQRQGLSVLPHSKQMGRKNISSPAAAIPALGAQDCEASEDTLQRWALLTREMKRRVYECFA